jgi:chromosome segregation ATPase
MERSLQAAEKRADKAEQRITVLEEEREEDRKTIEALQHELREVSIKAEHAEAAAGQAREAAAHLQQQLDAMVRTRNGRTN